MDVVFFVYLISILESIKSSLSVLLHICVVVGVLVSVFTIGFNVSHNIDKDVWQRANSEEIDFFYGIQKFKFVIKLAVVIAVIIALTKAAIPTRDDLKFIGGAYLANKVVNSQQFDSSTTRLQNWLEEEIQSLKANKSENDAKNGGK